MSSLLRSELEHSGLVVLAELRVDPLELNGYVGWNQYQETASAHIRLIGNSGSSMWSAFSQSSEYQDGQPDPLDRWSQRVGDQIASKMGSEVLYPFLLYPLNNSSLMKQTGVKEAFVKETFDKEPRYAPFIDWARRSDQLCSSKMGLSIHPKFGLWHAYRFALITLRSNVVEVEPQHPAFANPCDSCEGTPCLNTCPAGAYTQTGFNDRACYQYLASTPEADCHSRGCMARRACPEKTEQIYVAAHAKFHMSSFYRAAERRSSSE